MPRASLLFCVVITLFVRSSAVTIEDWKRWSEVALDHIRNISCSEAHITTEKQCRELSQITKKEMNFYLAEPSPDGPFLAVLPDGSLFRDGTHDGVLVLDPYPLAHFGHLVIAFYLDLNTDENRCSRKDGRYLGNGECLSLVLNSKCIIRHMNDKRCEINFIPLVYQAFENPNQKHQKLLCRDVLGFASCPKLRPRTETDKMMCDQLQLNAQRCPESEDIAKPRCRVTEVCDHAILLSGGWNWQIGKLLYKDNIRSFYEMLRENGFRRSNIKVFYANGVSEINVSGDTIRSAYPYSLKLSFRLHLKKICESSHCADSLVIYLNNPTRYDGSSLLWDINGNGQTERNEVYTTNELSSDLENCQANQVYVIADQNYAGLLVDEFCSSSKHSNVQIFASSGQEEYSWRGEFTRHWAKFDHSHNCVQKIQQASETVIQSSTPVFYDGSNGKSKKTIFGASCETIPPYSLSELKKRYFGCQTVSPSVWMSRNPNN